MSRRREKNEAGRGRHLTLCVAGHGQSSRKFQRCFSGARTQFVYGVFGFSAGSLQLAELLAVSHPFSKVVPSCQELQWLMETVVLLVGPVCSVGVESCANVVFGCSGTRKMQVSRILENAIWTLVIAALHLQCLALPGIVSHPAAFTARSKCSPWKIQLFLAFFEENSI